jgi:hypothetical protein
MWQWRIVDPDYDTVLDHSLNVSKLLNRPCMIGMTTD